jgi:hypothetical protein
MAITATIAYALAQSEDFFRVVGVRKGDVLNMRASPDGDAPKTGTIPADASGIVRVGDCTTWCQVAYEGKIGWVSRRFLAPIARPKAPPAPTIVSTDPVGDCNSDDAPRKLAGCTALITKGSLEPAVLGIAYSRRSDAYLDAGDLDAVLLIARKRSTSSRRMPPTKRALPIPTFSAPLLGLFQASRRPRFVITPRLFVWCQPTTRRMSAAAASI